MLKIADPQSGAIPEVRRALSMGLISANDGLNALEESPEVQREAMEMIFNGRTGKFARAVSMIRNDGAQAEFLASEEVLKAAASGGIVLHHSTVAGLKDLVEAGTVDAIVTFPPAGEGHYRRIAGPPGVFCPFPQGRRGSLPAGKHRKPAGAHGAYES